jgi:hypothetical protein
MASGMLLSILLGSTALPADNQSPTQQDAITFEEKGWELHEVTRAAVEDYRGKTALRVQGQHTDSSVFLPGVEFKDGTIEVDIAALDRTQPGIGFRGRAGGMWRNEIIFNFWPVKGERAAKHLEQAVLTRKDNTVLVLNIRQSARDDVRCSVKWFHVKIVVRESKVQIYLDGNGRPSIEMGNVFDETQRGAIGLFGGDFYFANFSYTSDEK